MSPAAAPLALDAPDAPACSALRCPPRLPQPACLPSLVQIVGRTIANCEGVGQGAVVMVMALRLELELGLRPT